MSAIWGAINLHGNHVPNEHKRILKDAFGECVIDRVEELADRNVYMGCGIQYFTSEAEYETLPCKQDGVYFDADVVLDNRKELLQRLEQEDSSSLPDGQILFDYYSKYRDKALNELIGAYVFVKYTREQNEVQIVSDAVGYRYIYYLIQDGIFYYASLMKPLEEIIKKREINNRWIADFIGQDNLNMFTESEETPILGINRIAPAHIMRISEKGIEKERYWDPYKDVKKIRYKSDEEYKEKFLELYKECVTSMLRSNGETAILLSGGYDSTSIASIAARELNEYGKKLYSFTSVPFKGYESEFNSKVMVDETEMVKRTQEYFLNLECEFMHLPDMNGWYDRKKYMRVAEVPYKSPQNMLWMYEGMKKAYQKNARIMFSGAFGNGTVSFDNREMYLVWLIQRGHWIRFYKELNAYKEKHHYIRKSVAKSTIKKAFGFDKNKITEEDLFHSSFANKEFLRKHGSVHRLLKLEQKWEKEKKYYKNYQKAFMPLETMRHYGEFAQKNSLYTGVILRDPTKDKRMIAFTLGIPYNQFTNNGVFRRLITEYMKDMMPPHILNERRVGRQSADLKARMCKHAKVIQQEWIQCFEKYRSSHIIDCEKALKLLYEKKMDELTDFEIVRYIFTANLLEYIEEKNNKSVRILEKKDKNSILNG